MPLQNAIEVLMLAQKELCAQKVATPQAEEVFDAATFSQHPGAAILQKASDVYFGVGDEVEDKKEALRLLNQAKALNFAPAFTCLADYFNEEANTLYFENEHFDCQELREKALEVLKEGAQKGHGRCYAKMSELYDGYCWPFNVKPEPENANKCWKKYFRSATFINDDDQKWAWGLSLASPRGGRSRANYAFNYLDRVFRGWFVLDPEIRQILFPLRAEIIAIISRCIEINLEKESSDAEHFRCLLKFVESSP
jgi:tetratricopeptide (TPR) repeat protein